MNRVTRDPVFPTGMDWYLLSFTIHSWRNCANASAWYFRFSSYHLSLLDGHSHQFGLHVPIPLHILFLFSKLPKNVQKSSFSLFTIENPANLNPKAGHRRPLEVLFLPACGRTTYRHSMICLIGYKH